MSFNPVSGRSAEIFPADRKPGERKLQPEVTAARDTGADRKECVEICVFRWDIYRVLSPITCPREVNDIPC